MSGQQQIKKMTKENQRAFTLIEMIVVMAVFLFVIGAAIGIFVSILQNQKRVLGEAQILNQISYAEEYMSKALRMAKTSTTPTDELCIPKGFIYELTHPNTDEGGAYYGIKFINQTDNDVCQEFYFEDGILYDKNVSKAENLPVALTPDNLQFNLANPIKFAINGSEIPFCENNICGAKANTPINPGRQPKITIILNVLIPGDKQVAGPRCEDDSGCSVNAVCDLAAHQCIPTRIIQTTISRRNLNVQ